METVVHSATGLVHLISSLLALIFGSVILFKRKGTPLHKWAGYAYVASMFVLIGSSFGLYGLTGSFGPFHYMSLLSLATLLSGFAPVLLRRPTRNWLGLHMTFMYYSVMGLYAAFGSEVIVRIPGVPFFSTITAATFGVIFCGMWIFGKKKNHWLASYGMFLKKVAKKT